MKTRYALNFFLSAIFVLSVFSMGHSNLRAVGTEQFIRVGLESHFREQDQISIYATNLAVGQFVGGVFHASGFLTTTGHFLARPDNSAYVQLPYTFTSLTHAQDRAIAIHENAIPVLLHNGHWGLYLPAGADFPGAIALSPSTARVSVSKADGQIVLISENGDVNLQVRDTTGITSLGTRRYRGAIELARFTGSRLTAVNVLALEEYLLSVVPAEMPPSWHMEALMAQAVAARTFAVHRMGSMAGRGYDVCDTTMSQVYVGVSNEHPNTTQAVNATQGIMILHNNTPIEAVYSSSSGGFTEYSENAWGTSKPYLRGVAEIYEPTAREWSRTITLSQLDQMMAAANINIGSATGLRLGKSAAGRVQELTIMGSTADHTITREAIRWAFTPSLYSRNFTIVGGTTVGGPTLPPTQQTGDGQAYVRSAAGVFRLPMSELYVISATGITAVNSDSLMVQSATDVSSISGGGNQNTTPSGSGIVATTTSSGYSIELSGRGWGHGVGMSQHGANGMAQRGYDFRQILHHYYTGVEIR